jgi:hypothetical protein
LTPKSAEIGSVLRCDRSALPRRTGIMGDGGVVSHRALDTRLTREFWCWSVALRPFRPGGDRPHVLKTQGFSLGCTPLALQAGGSYPSASTADGIENRVPTLGIRAGIPPDSPSPKAGLKGRRIRFSMPGAKQYNIKTRERGRTTHSLDFGELSRAALRAGMPAQFRFGLVGVTRSLDFGELSRAALPATNAGDATQL